MATDRTAPSFTVDDDAPKRPRVGRPPKTSGTAPRPTSARADAQDVRRALKTLEAGYSVIAAGLIMAGATQAADLWAEKSRDLETTNQTALEASPRLARMIANAGSGGGALTLLTTHVIALGPVIMVARAEIEEKTAARAAGEDPDAPRQTFAERLRGADPEPAAAPAQDIPRQPRPGPAHRDPRAQDPTFIVGL